VNDGNSGMDLTSITYDRLGRVQEIQSRPPGVGSGTSGPRINRQYDLHGNITGESYAFGPLAGMSVTNRYDSLLRRTNAAALKGSTVLASVNYAYDNASRLDQVTDGAVSAAFGYLQYSPLLQTVQFRHQGTNVMTTTRSYDFLDRLTSIASTTAAFSSSAAYGHNALNKITTLTNAGGDYWVYQYDAKGQVTAASRHWDDGTLVAGQQYEFAFDDMGFPSPARVVPNEGLFAVANCSGNPTLASKGGTSSGTDLRTSTASFNNLNQFNSRTVPGYAQSLGSAHSNATVTVNLTPTERKGEYSRGEVASDNTSAPVWASLTNTAELPAFVLLLDYGGQAARGGVGELPEQFRGRAARAASAGASGGSILGCQPQRG
jgi:YD repeat-containing protein